MADPARPARVLLCVTGGIAAYKAPELVRAFVAEGVEVRVIMTRGARNFVTELSLATVSGHPVRWELLDASAEGEVGHIELADWPDLVVVAPATADVLARAATGRADDLVTVCLVATRAPILWAPAMNTNMWRHPATRANLATLTARGARYVGPDQGALACGWVGEGRMIDPSTIVQRSLQLLQESGGKGSWAGRHVLVSAGPTREHLDPVRFVSNASSGAMGFALAEMAAFRGAEVTLVAGPVERETPPGVKRMDVTSGEQMLAALAEQLEAGPHDLVAMVAAVGDLVPATAAEAKVPKRGLLQTVEGATWHLAPDVLQTLTGQYGTSSFFLGFAAETIEAGTEDVDAELSARGRDKLARKGCQALFVNRVGVPETGFATATNAGLLLIDVEGQVQTHPLAPPMPKPALAARMLDLLHPHARVERGG